MLDYAVVESPVGPLTIVAAGERLMAVQFGDQRAGLEPLPVQPRQDGVRQHPDPAGAASALRAYFSGKLQALEHLVVDPTGTPFQQRVWSALRTVPAGRTASYFEIATAIGAP